METVLKQFIEAVANLNTYNEEREQDSKEGTSEDDTRDNMIHMMDRDIREARRIMAQYKTRW